MTPQLIRIIDILSYLNSIYNIKYERIIFKKEKKKKRKNIPRNFPKFECASPTTKQTNELLRHLSAVSRLWIHS